MKKLTLEITLTEEQFEEIKKINHDYESAYSIDAETTEQKFLNYLFEACMDRLQNHEEYTIEEFIEEYK